MISLKDTTKNAAERLRFSFGLVETVHAPSLQFLRFLRETIPYSAENLQTRFLSP